MIDPWLLIDTYFKTNKLYLTRHHIDSYDDLITNRIPNLIDTLNPTEIINSKFKDKRIKITFEKKTINYTQPKHPDGSDLLPNTARLQNHTYFSDIAIDIKVEYISKDKNNVENIQKTVYFKKHKIGSIPTMLLSKFCPLSRMSNNQLYEVGECMYDQGGYFVIDGKEKVVISQERIATNKLFINQSNDPLYFLEGMIRSTSVDKALFPKTVRFWVCQDIVEKKVPKTDEDTNMDSTDDTDDTTTKRAQDFAQNKIKSDGFILKMNIMNISLQHIPIFIIFRALGIESDKEILNYISYDDIEMNLLMRPTLIDHVTIEKGNTKKTVFSTEDALHYLSNFVKYKDINYVRYILLNDLFPNIGDDFRQKSLYLGHLVKELVYTTVNKRPQNKRDNYMFKRVDTTGILLGNIFRDFYNKFRNHSSFLIQQEFDSIGKNWTGLINHDNVKTIFNSKIISEGMYKSFKGVWGLTGDPSEQGIVQDLSRLSYNAYISHMRRVNTPIDRSIKLVEPHRLDSPQWGMMCPIESPDGSNIGLLKHMAATCEITLESDRDSLVTCLTSLKMKALSQVTPMNSRGNCKILLNNNWVGIHNDPHTLHKSLIDLRRQGALNAFISITWHIDDETIYIFSDSGRCIRPLLINNKQSDSKQPINISKWTDIVNGYTYKHTYKIKPVSNTNALVEYVDSFETNTLYIAMTDSEKTQKHTHIEIHPCLALSMYTNTIPLANHNQAPRNIFSGQQGKQAIGIYATNFNHRIDTASYILHYPQRNLVSTKMAKYVHKNQLPNGENLIVAICTYTGYNQEDSIIVNKSSIDRGMFNVSSFKSLLSNEESVLNERTEHKTIFSNPVDLKKSGKPIGIKLAHWEKIDKDGFPIENSYITDNDAYIGKVNIETEWETSENDYVFAEKKMRYKYRDVSSIADKSFGGTIDKVIRYNKENTLHMKARVRKFCVPELGDKMASSHGQKGVCGMVLEQHDMPYTKDGLVPDIIVNPHAFPSRMTVAHLIESVLAKLSCKSGSYVDGTAFENIDVDKYYDTLEDFGCHKHGDELMYNGFTGEQIPTKIFIGPTYYFRLKHMVRDKINYRERGSVEQLTKQPTQGRSHGGGLKIGEMENNAILGHGISSFIKESMMERSDDYSIFVDENSGDKVNLVDYDLLNQIPKKISIPYTMNLLMNEVNALGVKMSCNTKNN